LTLVGPSFRAAGRAYADEAAARLEDCREMSLRILRRAGPTKASPTGCARGGPLLEQPKSMTSAAATLTFVMEPANTLMYEFTSRTSPRPI
jgi:hypothetical protein